MNVHMIVVENNPKSIYSGHLKLGGANPRGERIGFTNYYMELNSRPFFGICGEFHYSRYPYALWEHELLKMKAAGVNIISTYIFWNHHEEDEGVFIWEGNRNLRDFIGLCGRHGLYVMLRTGPFSHGEARNGGFPDWLYGRPFTVRSNDEGYLHYARRLYHEIGRQVSGLMFKDGGPVIGIQLENEHMHASPSWEFLVTDEFEWVGAGRDGASHIEVLKKMALESGLDAPIYTCTGWGGASFIEDETLPIYGGYAFQPWLFVYCNEKISSHKPTNEYLIQSFHDKTSSCIEFDPPYDPEKYPYACCELGGGMACWYGYRFRVEPESIEAATLVRIAGGCNFIGYYMFHDGTNPVGKHGYLNEHVVPKVSYPFQAPIGEYGQLRDSYRYLKPVFYFLRDFEELLCPMGTVLPEEVRNLAPADCETLRYAVRQKDGAGFLFLVNYQDHFEMKDHEDISVEIRLPGEIITIPGGAAPAGGPTSGCPVSGGSGAAAWGAFPSGVRHGLTLKKNVSAILPFNLDLDGILLKYSTAQLITYIADDNARTYFFFAPDGMASEYCFVHSNIICLEAEYVEVYENGGLTFVKAVPGLNCVMTLTTGSGKKITICTITRKDALGFWKLDLWGRERVVISNAGLALKDGNLEAVSTEELITLDIYPYMGCSLSTAHGKTEGKKNGIFTSFAIAFPRKKIVMDMRRSGMGNAVLEVAPFDFTDVNEVYLHVDYLGNVGNAFMDGALISDDFCNGEIWEIGLKRYCPDVFQKGLYFHVIPYNKGSSVVFDRDLRFRHRFSDGPTAEIFSVEAVPEYKVTIAQGPESGQGTVPCPD